ncbi:hypothetical protein B0H11DRAFT_565297 [Mycena galericulata]|nr:hypothetical protein B0H11DRAFT_565297 [Mycena galericulata]
MKKTNNPMDQANLARFPDQEGVQPIFLAVDAGHWSIVWPVPHQGAPPGADPAGYRSIEVMLDNSEYKFRESFRRADGETQGRWVLFRLGHLSLRYRDAMVEVAAEDELRERGDGEGDCRDCVSRTVWAMKRRGTQEGFEEANIRWVIKEATKISQ